MIYFFKGSKYSIAIRNRILEMFCYKHKNSLPKFFCNIVNDLELVPKAVMKQHYSGDQFDYSDMTVYYRLELTARLTINMESKTDAYIHAVEQGIKYISMHPDDYDPIRVREILNDFRGRNYVVPDIWNNFVETLTESWDRNGNSYPMHDMSYKERSVPTVQGEEYRLLYGQDMFLRANTIVSILQKNG